MTSKGLRAGALVALTMIFGACKFEVPGVRLNSGRLFYCGLDALTGTGLAQRGGNIPLILNGYLERCTVPPNGRGLKEFTEEEIQRRADFHCRAACFAAGLNQTRCHAYRQIARYVWLSDIRNGTDHCPIEDRVPLGLSAQDAPPPNRGGCQAPGETEEGAVYACKEFVSSGPPPVVDTCRTCDYAVACSSADFYKGLWGLECTNVTVHGQLPLPTKGGAGPIQGSLSVILQEQVATVSADEDSSRRGIAIGQDSFPSLAFAPTANGILIYSFVVPIRNFIFEGQPRRRGTAVMMPTGAVATAGAIPGVYSLASGAAEFRMTAADEHDKGAVVDAVNESDLIIDLNDAIGPRVRGVLAGSLQGHGVHATVDARLAWLNRPPIAHARAIVATLDSSRSEAARPRVAKCSGSETIGWRGDPEAVTLVRLDASGSIDPDPLDVLTYAWNGRAAGATPVTSWLLPHGKYKVSLAVQDQYGVTSVTDIEFQVVDQARPVCDTPHDVEYRIKRFLTRPSTELGRLAADLQRAVQVTESSPASTVLTRENVRGLVKSQRRLRPILKRVSRPEFSVHDVRTRRSAPDVLCGPGGVLPAPAAFCGECGDQRCDVLESCESCPGDCPFCEACGDDICSGEERCSTCPLDCGPCDTCGNGRCERTESTSTCSPDCFCGNGLCDRGETTANCADDCYCGNGACDEGESQGSCPEDCFCGNRTCDQGESIANCSGDCSCGDGMCDVGEEGCPDCTCGDGVCDSTTGERSTNCFTDCHCGDGVCRSGFPAFEDASTCFADCHCGDGICNDEFPTLESTVSCAADCYCGDGVCDSSERQAICPGDCGPL